MKISTYFVGTIMVLALLAAGAAMAQEKGDGYFGFQGGLIIANMGGDMDGADLAQELEDEFGGTWTADKKARTGLLAGLTYARMFGPKAGIQIEANYASRGVKFDVSDGSATVDTQLKFNYLEVPVLLRFMPSAGAKTQPVFVVGPVIGFKMSPKISASGNGATIDGDLEGIKSTAIGLEAGAALRIPAGEKSAVMLQARYHLGLSNAIDDANFSSKAGDFMIMAGLEFGLGK